MGLLDTLGQISGTLRGVNDLFGNINQFQNVINPNPQPMQQPMQKFGTNPLTGLPSIISQMPYNVGINSNTQPQFGGMVSVDPDFYRTAGFNPDAQLQQPVGGYGGNPPPVNTPFPTTPFPKQPTIPQPQPNTFANRLKDFGNIYADYIIGRSNAGKASFDPSSGDEAFVNNSGLANAMNQYKNREALKTLQGQQAFDNQMSALNTQTSQQKNFQYRQSLSPQEQKEFDKYLTSSSKGNLPASVQEYQFYKGLPKSEQGEFFRLKRKGFEIKDFGDSFKVIDNTGAIVQTISKGLSPENQPKNVFEKEVSKINAKEYAELKIQFPQIQQEMTEKIQIIDQMLNDPNLGSYLGKKAKLIPDILVAGTPTGDFRRKLGMIKGKEFLAQFDKLRGGGQISNTEGEQALRAGTSLDDSLTEEAFRQELLRLRKIAETASQKKFKQIQNLNTSEPQSNNEQELFYDPETDTMKKSDGTTVK